MLTLRSHAHPFRRSLSRGWHRPGWTSAGALALVCSTVAWASLPRGIDVPTDQQREWNALGLAPLSSGGATGVAMAPTAAVQPLEFVPRRASQLTPEPQAAPAPTHSGAPVRIRGQAGDGLYWSLRAAGASPEVAAQYLAALATEIDVGEVAAGDSFDLVLGSNHQLLYAGLQRIGQSALQLVRWSANGRSEWIDANNAERPVPGGRCRPVSACRSPPPGGQCWTGCVPSRSS